MTPRLGALLWVMAGAILLASSCATAPAAQARDDEAAVRAVLDTYARAVSSGDVELCRTVCAGEPVGARAVPFARPASATTAVILNRRLALAVDTALAYGDWSIARGTYSLATGAVGGMPDSGAFMAILERQADGGWKITELRHGSMLLYSSREDAP
jgi:ketosteroid isomerase-like protein